MRLRARASIDRFDKPRKSIFSSPKSAHGSIAYCVIATPDPSALPFVGRCSGTMFISGSCDMTTAAACVLLCRVSPSIPIAVSTSPRTSPLSSPS